MPAYKIDFAADRKAAAAGDVTLHIGTKNRSGYVPAEIEPTRAAPTAQSRSTPRLTNG